MPIEVRNDVAPALVGGMAFATGQGLYDERQAQIARQEQAEQNRIAAQLYAQNQQRAANERMAMFQHAAGLQDMYGRAALGEWGAQQQHGRMLEMDDRNFAQQKQRDEWNAALQDKSWENHLNAQGKTRKAEIDAQRARLDAFFSGPGWDMGKPDHKRKRDAAYAQHEAAADGIKEPHSLMPDPPPVESRFKDNIIEYDGDKYLYNPKTDSFDPVTSKRQIAEENTARAKAIQDAEGKNRIEVAKIKAEEAAIARKEQLQAKEDDRRAKMEESAYKRYSEMTDRDGNQIHSESEAQRLAEEEADRRMGYRQRQAEQNRDTWEQYRAAQFDAVPEFDLPEWETLTETGQRIASQEAGRWKGAQEAAMRAEQAPKMYQEFAKQFEATTGLSLPPIENLPKARGGQTPPQPSGGGGFRGPQVGYQPTDRLDAIRNKDKLPTISSDAQYDDLPPASWYVDDAGGVAQKSGTAPQTAAQPAASRATPSTTGTKQDDAAQAPKMYQEFAKQFEATTGLSLPPIENDPARPVTITRPGDGQVMYQGPRETPEAQQAAKAAIIAIADAHKGGKRWTVQDLSELNRLRELSHGSQLGPAN